ARHSARNATAGTQLELPSQDVRICRRVTAARRGSRSGEIVYTGRIPAADRECPIVEVENLLRADGLSRSQVRGSARPCLGSRGFRWPRALCSSGSGGG